MKRILFALFAALLVLGLFSPFSAQTVSAAACGDTYTVQKGDYLTKIAKTCGVTYDSLVKANPEIKDVNKIYPGQVIRIKAGATLPTTVNYTVVQGDTLYKIAVRYGTTVAKLLELNPDIKDSNKIYTGQIIKLPANSSGGTVPPTGGPVTVSATSAKAGASITVKVTGFPANANIDFRMGKDGQAFSVVVDAKTNASGAASANITIPSTAKAGEKWVVTVLTTDMPKGKNKEAKSPLITIAQ